MRLFKTDDKVLDNGYKVGIKLHNLIHIPEIDMGLCANRLCQTILLLTREWGIRRLF